MVKILVCDGIHDDGIGLMKNSGITVDLKLNLKVEELKDLIGKYDGVVVRGKTKITKEVMENSPNLKFIARAGVGLDNIDVEAAKTRGIKILSTPRAISQAVAELTIGLMIAVSRCIPFADLYTKKGEWIKSRLIGGQLAGKTLGIIGFGRIGIKVAKIAKAIGMKILVYDIMLINQPLKEKYVEEASPLDEDPVTENERLESLKEVEAEVVSLEQLLERSDVISLHIPLTEKTKHLIGEKEFSLMKKRPIIINTARGALIDREALNQALNSGKIPGVGLDVYDVEPPTNLEMLCLPNVVCTPHIGAQTEEAQRETSIQIAEKIVNFWKVINAK